MEDLDPGFGTEGERVGTAKEEEREEAKGAGEKGKGVCGGGGRGKEEEKKKKKKGERVAYSSHAPMQINLR